MSEHESTPAGAHSDAGLGSTQRREDVDCVQPIGDVLTGDERADRTREPFIPGWLDDAGLTPNQFRVYCHIRRRGVLFDSYRNTAKRLRLNKDTFGAALSELVDMGAILKTKRHGKTTEYRATNRVWRKIGVDRK